MNKLQMTKDELDKLVKSQDLELYTKEQFVEFIKSNEDVLVKGSGTEELDELEKSEYDTLQAEIGSFAEVEVWSHKPGSSIQLEKSILYVRPKQVEWTEELVKSEDSDELVKAKSGVYTNTALNRKLGRVGQKYGSKKEGEEDKDSEKKKEGKSDINL